MNVLREAAILSRHGARAYADHVITTELLKTEPMVAQADLDNHRQRMSKRAAQLAMQSLLARR